MKLGSGLQFVSARLVSQYAILDVDCILRFHGWISYA